MMDDDVEPLTLGAQNFLRICAVPPAPKRLAGTTTLYSTFIFRSLPLPPRRGVGGIELVVVV